MPASFNGYGQYFKAGDYDQTAGTDATIGGPGLAIVAGPCGIETREQAFAAAERVHRAGAQFFRGGAYKPRTSP